MRRAVAAPVAALGLLLAAPAAATPPAESSPARAAAEPAREPDGQPPEAQAVGSGEPASTRKLEPSAAPPLEVVVVGQRRPAEGTTVQVVRRRDMERLGATTVVDAIEQLASSAASFGSRGERIFSLRGFTQRQVMVMIDGVPVSMPYDGQLDLSKLPLGLVDHVTVVQGAGSLLYGPNGLGGAVNVATREPGQGPRMVLSTEAAPGSTFRASVLTNARVGRVGAIVGTDLENSAYVPMSAGFTPTWNEDGDRRNNSDRRSGMLMGKLRWELDDEHSLVGTVSHLTGHFGVPPGVYDLTPRYWRWTEWHVDTLALAHAFRGSRLAIDETVYLSSLGNRLDSYDDGTYSSQRLPVSFSSAYGDTSLGAQARLSYQLPWGDGDQTTLRGWVGARRDAHGAEASGSGSALEVETVILTGAVQAEATFLQRLHAMAGVQIDGELPGERGSGASPDPGLGVGPLGSFSVRVLDGLALSASVAERTRFPTLRERFSEAFGAREPNPGLEPERATNLALDVTVEPSSAVRLDVGVFDSEVRDLVIPVVVRPQTEQLQNAGRARLAGVEARAHSAVSRWLEVEMGWAWIDAHRLDLAAPEDHLANQPEQKARLALTVHPVAWLSLTGAVRWLGAQELQNPDTLAWGKLGSAYLLDARVELRPVAGLTVWARSSNLADDYVQARYSFPEPGRQIFVGASAQWPGVSR